MRPKLPLSASAPISRQFDLPVVITTADGLRLILTGQSTDTIADYAAYIVAVCNSHDALLGACKNMADRLEAIHSLTLDAACKTGDKDEILELAYAADGRAAIKAAEEVPS